MTSARLTIEHRARFEIKIVADGSHDQPAVNFFDEDEANIVLHLVARMQNDLVVVNTRVGAQWDAERHVAHHWEFGAELTLRLTLSGQKMSLHGAGVELSGVEIPGGLKAADIRSIGLYGPVTIRRVGGVFVEMDGITSVDTLCGTAPMPAEVAVSAPVGDADHSVYREIRYFTQPAPEFEEFLKLPQGSAGRAKLLAYYLPQFHAFAENDQWWGKGFTEWTNVARGMPRFKGHYQPRVPRDLGFYDLADSGTLRCHAELARDSGLDGFIFYYYWFNGKRLMAKPLEDLLADHSIDLPFALMWANENWTRRWDGLHEDVLISQDYRVEDDSAMVAEFARHFADPRYIRLGGNRPLLVIYRPGIIPDAKDVLLRWRRMFREDCGEDPIFVMAQGFGDRDPADYGFDGAIEFPPHKVAAGLPRLNPQLSVLDADFSADVFGYDDVVARSLGEAMPAYPIIRAAMPGWDNDARRQGAGMVVHGSSPAKYQAWLEQIIDQARHNPFFGAALAVAGAWNEWAEGNYLEPDLHFGAAYLNAVGRAAAGVRAGGDGAQRLLLIGPDAEALEPQQLLLRLAAVWQRQCGMQIEFLLLGGGPLRAQYAAVGQVVVAPGAARQREALAAFRARGFTCAVAGGAAAAGLARLAQECRIECVALIHEMKHAIEQQDLIPALRDAARFAKALVFPAAAVRNGVLDALKGARVAAKMLVHPTGLHRPLRYDPEDAARVRGLLGIAADEPLVVGAGHGELRQGFDLFVQLWRQARRDRGERVHFCWLGACDDWLLQWIEPELSDALASGTFHLVADLRDRGSFVAAAAALALTAREDALPEVALEALSAGTAVVAFEGSGGIPELLAARGVGAVVAYADVPAMLAAILRAIAGEAGDSVAARQGLIADEFDWDHYAAVLLGVARPDLATVSVMIPNYNYARYLEARLASVFAQAYPVREVVVLDDASADGSLPMIPAIAHNWHRDVTLVPNPVNSGSVFAQWRKAAARALGDFVWIAEADDLSDPLFVPVMIEALQKDPRIAFAFCDSRSIGSDGVALAGSYKPYYATVEPGGLARSELFKGSEFARRFLSVRNLILNVSAVVWRRDALARALEACGAELETYRVAGDWRLYLEALTAPLCKVAYEARALNVHRRHVGSVTHRLDAERHLAEIARAQAFAKHSFDLDRSVARQQRGYLQEMALQLGAAETLVPKLARKLTA